MEHAKSAQNPGVPFGKEIVENGFGVPGAEGRVPQPRLRSGPWVAEMVSGFPVPLNSAHGAVRVSSEVVCGKRHERCIASVLSAQSANKSQHLSVLGRFPYGGVIKPTQTGK